MIEIIGVDKSYDGGSGGRKRETERAVTQKAVNGLTMTMRENEVFGLVGTNGAGKTTLLRMMAGVLRPDEGEILIDGLSIYDNPKAKALFLFIPDDPFYFPNTNAIGMMSWYASTYPNFSQERFHRLMADFSLDEHRRIAGYSKGMKKQLAVIFGLSAQTKYLFCDETFDGLDPVMRQVTKSLMAKDMEDRGLTTILTSHNLRELEDICDHVGLLHRGGVLLSKDIADMKVDVQKVQVVFRDEQQQKDAEAQLTIMEHRRQGRMHVYTVRRSAAELEIIFRGIDTVFFEILPLTLEEIFISETEVVGYDIQKIING